MNEEHTDQDELLQELRQIRHSIKHAGYVLAGGMVLSALIVAGFFAPGGEVVWSIAIVVALLWAFIYVVASTFGRVARNRVAVRIDRERKAALSGRATKLSPINK